MMKITLSHHSTTDLKSHSKMNKEPNEIDVFVQKLCHSGLQLLDSCLLKSLLDTCLKNDTNLEKCHGLLIEYLMKPHSEIRYSAFQICAALFDNSSLFRELILNEFQSVVEYILDINPLKPLPPPKKAENELKKLAITTIKKWHDNYGKDYKMLAMGFNYLKNCKKIDFVTYNYQNPAQRRHTEQEAKKREMILNSEFTKCCVQLDENEIDIKTCIDQINNCFDILIPKPDELFEVHDTNKSFTNQVKNSNNVGLFNCDDSDTDDDDFVEVKDNNNQDELRFLGFFNDQNSEYTRNFQLNLNIGLNINEDNKIVIENMKGLYKELKNVYLSRVNHFIQIFSTVKTGAIQLKRAIDLKSFIQNSINRFDSLGLPGIDIEKKQSQNSKPSTIAKQTITKINKSTGSCSNELLDVAPVFDIDQMEFGASLITNIQTDHKYYQRNDISGDTDNPTTSSTIAKKVFIGKNEPITWKCRAPLKNGKLCERMDRIKCPFHGKIIGRDSKDGKATNTNEETIKKDEYMPLGDDSFLNDLEQTTGKQFKSVKKPKIKTGNLTDLKTLNNTSRKRLEKQVCNPKSLKKIGSILDNIEKRQNYDKFHHNFNYSLNQ